MYKTKSGSASSIQPGSRGAEPSFSLKLSYGIGALGEGIGYNVFYSFFIFFLTSVAGVRPGIAGAISMIAVAWDAVTDPMIGAWSDRTKNPIGRRRPFIITGSVLCAASVVLLFLNVPLPAELKTAYYVLINILFWASITSCVIPHISLGTDLTDDYNGRTNLRGFATLFLNTGTLIATSATLMIVKFYSSLFLDTNRAWLFMGLTYGVIILLAYQISCFRLRGKEPANPNLRAETNVSLSDANALCSAAPASSQTSASSGSQAERSSAQVTGSAASKKSPLLSLLENYQTALRNRPLVCLLVITFVTNLVVGLASSLLVYIFTYLYGYDEVASSSMFLFQGILYVALVAVVTVLSNRLGKKWTMLLGQLCYGAAYFAMFLFPATLPTLLFTISAGAFGNVIYWTLIYSMAYDTTVIEEVRSGETPTGLYVSLIGLVMKIGTSVGMFISGVGLDLIGFDPAAAVQSQPVLSGLKDLFSLIPAVLFLAGAAAAAFYPLTKKAYEALSAKRAAL